MRQHTATPHKGKHNRVTSGHPLQETRITTEITASATTEDTTSRDAWEGFVRGSWAEDIDVRDFIQRNYTPYDGDASFLAGARRQIGRASCRERV